MGIKHGYQSDDCAEKCDYVDGRMDEFQVLLAGVTEASVDENGCGGRGLIEMLQETLRIA